MKFLSVAIITSIIFLIASCKKNKGGDAPFVPNCNGAATSFSSDVFPIFKSVCSQTDCHDSGSANNGPGPLTNYAEINAARGNIREAIRSGLMPQNTTLTAAQKNSIICWVDAGAPNN